MPFWNRKSRPQSTDQVGFSSLRARSRSTAVIDPETQRYETIIEQIYEDLVEAKFMKVTKFLLSIVHNIVQNPNTKRFRKMRTKSPTVMEALTHECVSRLIREIGLQKLEDHYELFGDLEGDRLAALKKIEAALVKKRKSTGWTAAWELELMDIEILDKLGAGAFGDVHEGRWMGQPVAIKTLKRNVDKAAKEDFFQEADIMKDLDHRNVMHLHGVIQAKHPNLIVMPLMTGGNLRELLRKTRFTTGELLTMAVDLVAGLEYMHDKEILHCDIAARNVLVNGDTSKLLLADFGLARHADIPEECDTSKRTFPISVRWSAPEVFKTRILSKKTDVYSWGILFYEIMTAGAVPYIQWKNKKVSEKVQEGYRLPCPENCPESCHDVMMDAWKHDPELRPSMTEIFKKMMILKVELAAANHVRSYSLSASQASSASSIGPSAARVDGPFSFFMSHLATDDDVPEIRPEMRAEHFDGQSLDDVKFYHGELPFKNISEAAEPLLSHNGDFLLHTTRNTNEIVLSVQKDTPRHVILKTAPNGSIHHSGKQYATILQLLKEHVLTSNPIVLEDTSYRLRFGVPRSQEDETRIRHASQVRKQAIAQAQEDTAHHAYLSCLTVEDGAFARTLYAGLEGTERAQDRFVCWLDQFDLQTVGTESPEETQLRMLKESKVFIPILSERSLDSLNDPEASGLFATELAQAMLLYKQGCLDIIPVCVGAMIVLNHPTKPDKLFEVFDSFDRTSAEGASEALVENVDEQVTVKQVVEFYLDLANDGGYYLDPFDDQLEGTCDQIVAWFMETYPEAVDTANLDVSALSRFQLSRQSQVAGLSTA